MIQNVIDNDKRKIWAATRAVIELKSYKSKRSGKKSRSNWNLFVAVLQVFALFLKISGLYKKGFKNACNPVFNHTTLQYKELPESFHGFTILHLSDLHLDSIPKFEQMILDRLINQEFDICVITGDFRMNNYGSFSDAKSQLKTLTENLKTRHGIFAVLGNHDSYLFADFENEMPIRFLINESISIEKNNQCIFISGTDDPFRYYTDAAVKTLEENIPYFKIALVHTSELKDVAANNGYNLYLCGHTHGGQICFPGGQPIINHQFEGKKYVKGLWKYLNMYGYTSSGTGVSGMPLRFNCNGEISVITLNRN